MPNLNAWLPALNILLIVAGAAALVIVFRSQQARTVSEVQERVITALRQENQVLTEQMASLRVEVRALRQVLQSRGIVVKINGQFVTITDSGAPKQTSIRLRKDEIAEIATNGETAGQDAGG